MEKPRTTVTMRCLPPRLCEKASPYPQSTMAMIRQRRIR
jgi:hypothetical protein